MADAIEQLCAEYGLEGIGMDLVSDAGPHSEPTTDGLDKSRARDMDTGVDNDKGDADSTVAVEDSDVGTPAALLQGETRSGDSTSATTGAAAGMRGFVSRLLQAMLRAASCAPQLSALAEGLADVLPVAAFPLFAPEELEELIAGSAEIDVAVLREATRYEGSDLASQAADEAAGSPGAPHIAAFWAAFESMNQEERSEFVNFVSGYRRLPRSAADFPMHFKIQTMTHQEGKGDTRLPESQTCFFSLKLPKYSCAAACKKKLILAMRLTPNMDNDVNERNVSVFTELDD